MADQILIQFRADKALKQEVSDIYEALGMDLPTALRMFMMRSKMVNGLPFEATLPESYIERQQLKKAAEQVDLVPLDAEDSDDSDDAKTTKNKKHTENIEENVELFEI